MGIRGTNAGGGRRANGGRGRAGRRSPAAALFAAFLLVALAAVIVALLPTARGGAGDPSAERGTDAEGQRPNVAQLLRPERAAEPEPPTALVEPPPPEEPWPIEPAREPEPPTALQPERAEPPTETPGETRDRGLFFISVENDGDRLLLTRVDRAMRVSDTPLTDALNALLSGPTALEAAQGVVSFISPDARLLSARVEGRDEGGVRMDTAYLNFNECFQYNVRGSEGLESQVRQIVWTATEFPNVRDVQILIEGNRVDFLHGGIMIGRPIGR